MSYSFFPPVLFLPLSLPSLNFPFRAACSDSICSVQVPVPTFFFQAFPRHLSLLPSFYFFSRLLVELIFITSNALSRCFLLGSLFFFPWRHFSQVLLSFKLGWFLSPNGTLSPPCDTSKAGGLWWRPPLVETFSISLFFLFFSGASFRLIVLFRPIFSRLVTPSLFFYYPPVSL